MDPWKLPARKAAPRQAAESKLAAQEGTGHGAQGSGAPSIIPAQPELLPGRIDKSQLAVSEPKRLRDKQHLKFVASQPCLICGRQPSDPHHLRFAQPRAIGLKVSDEFTVPLCRGHHRELHQAGNELIWWEKRKIKPLRIAKALWEQTRPRLARVPLQPDEKLSKEDVAIVREAARHFDGTPGEPAWQEEAQGDTANVPPKQATRRTKPILPVSSIE